MAKTVRSVKAYVNLSPELYARLESLCEYLSVTKSSFMTMAIAQYVQQQEAIQNMTSNQDFIKSFLGENMPKLDK